DLIGPRKDVKVTEIRVYNDQGAQMSSYLIGLAAKNGVFVLSVSPAKKDIDPLVKELVSSFKLVPRKLDAEETKRLSSEAKAQHKRNNRRCPSPWRLKSSKSPQSEWSCRHRKKR